MSLIRVIFYVNRKTILIANCYFLENVDKIVLSFLRAQSALLMFSVVNICYSGERLLPANFFEYNRILRMKGTNLTITGELGIFSKKLICFYFTS